MSKPTISDSKCDGVINEHEASGMNPEEIEIRWDSL